MPGKFCPRCGDGTASLYEGLCSKCFLEKSDVLKGVPDKVSVALCRECGMVYIAGKGFRTVEDAIEYAFKNLNIKEAQSVSYRIDKNKLIAGIYFRLDDLEERLEKEVVLKKSVMVCKFCNMKFSGYYTTVLQIRGKVNLDQIFKEIEAQVDNLKKQDNLAFISGVTSKREGIDVYLGSKSAAGRICNRLKTRYRIKTKISSTLHGKIRGKSAYRDTILVQFEDKNG